MMPVAAGAAILILMVAVVLVFHKPHAMAMPASTPTPLASALAPAHAVAENPIPTPAPAPTPAPTGTSGQCRAMWTFDQDSGYTVLDTTGNGYNGQLTGLTTVWLKAESSDSSGLSMDGSDYMEVAAPVVNTAQSFTACSWVKLDAMGAKIPQAIVSIDGMTNSGFVLGFFPYTGAGKTGGRFELCRWAGDSKEAPASRALTKYGVSTRTWYHLAGVYDAKAQTISLYLNGILQTNMPCADAWQATGKTAVGRGLWDGRAAHFLQGTVRDVRFYDAALTPDQIKEIAK
jgi:alpha-N-arabinofuranosidase